MENSSKNYWNNRWETNTMTWDVGYPTPPIVDFFEKNKEKYRHSAILIPGCGSGHEALWLLENGFSNITLSEISPIAAAKLRQKFGQRLRVIEGDFFELTEKFDLVIEQTFFCAIDPSLREKYVQKMHEILTENGKLVGLLFECDFVGGPPFSGNRAEYRALFEPFFEINSLEITEKSISSRLGRELWVSFSRISKLRFGCITCEAELRATKKNLKK
jgi:methyl halide transferase